MSTVAISVILPTIPSRTALYAEALACLEAQTLPRDQFEIVTACDPSEDATKFNRMLERCTGEFVLWHADDDRLRPRCLEQMLSVARATGAHVVSGDVQTFSAGGWGASPVFNGAPWTFESFRGGPPIWITSLVHRERAIAAGGFDFARLVYADWALWYELWKRGAKNAHISETLWDYRAHSDQASARIDATACRAAFYAHYPELFP
jgi:hypothetical protein